ncbi:hypothetical protein HJC23_008310 [Cyclotella cryptica]|uniref:Mitogen-activated protein kinase n=1 Tax=Cyclotella cryptica TaxID=29204 RepID=A0ABD3QAM3_9STRA|eukprot:CCRYP_008574-RA/>CCRYP_008574-RA protein AED:0.02 eAED:0.02 QI:0/0/0/1/1/1/2/0/390
MADVIDPRVLRRFDVCQKLGQGAYGIVWKATQRKSGAVVALKKCFEAFRCNVDAQRTFREVMYLRALSGHENIVKIHSVVRADNDKDLYITFDYMETDLNQVIKARILEDIHIRYVIYQLLKALKYIHSAKLLHRDIKPSNILLDASCRLKLCDFGLCRSIAEGETLENVELTDYVATRWYRSPEVLMGSKKYTVGLDLWSVGCILGEMFRTRPLLPGASTMNQLEKIFEVTGNPSARDVQSWQSPFAASMVDNVKASCRVKLDEICHELPKSAKILIKSLFKLNPAKRGTAEIALEHEYVADFHDAEAETAYPYGPIKIGISDNTQLSADNYRKEIYKSIDDIKEESRRLRHDMKQQESNQHSHSRRNRSRRDDMTRSTDAVKKTVSSV